MIVYERRYKLIENGATHTDGLKLADAEEMLERYERTFPDLEFWIERDWSVTYIKR